MERVKRGGGMESYIYYFYGEPEKKSRSCSQKRPNLFNLYDHVSICNLNVMLLGIDFATYLLI